MLETPDQSFDTRAVHAGRDPPTPISYGGNPTIDALEASVAEFCWRSSQCPLFNSDRMSSIGI